MKKLTQQLLQYIRHNQQQQMRHRRQLVRQCQSKSHVREQQQKLIISLLVTMIISIDYINIHNLNITLLKTMIDIVILIQKMSVIHQVLILDQVKIKYQLMIQQFISLIMKQLIVIHLLVLIMILMLQLNIHMEILV